MRAPAAASLRDAADLAFMIDTSRTAGDVLLRRSVRDRSALEPGDIVEEGYLLEVRPDEDRVSVTRVRHVADEVRSPSHYSYRTVRYESEDLSFREFAESGWIVDALEKWGDGDPDARQVGNASCWVSPDRSSATASVDAALQERSWPRRGIGRFHDDIEVTLDSSGQVSLRSGSLGRLYEGKVLDMFELLELGRRCREAGVEFGGGRVSLPAGKGE